MSGNKLLHHSLFNNRNNDRLKELQRVFHLLCNYGVKHKLRTEIADVEEKRLHQQLQHSDTSIISLFSDALAKSTEERLNELKQELQIQENKSDSKITVCDVLEMYKFLNVKISKSEAEEMVWEVDEDLDGSVSWAEFKLMFSRNITDTTGLEPSRLVSQFHYKSDPNDSFFVV